MVPKSIIIGIPRVILSIYGLACSSAKGLGLIQASFLVGAAEATIVSLEILFILPN